MVLWLLLFAILLCFGIVRCFIFNIHRVVYYTVFDLVEYIRFKKWKDFNFYGIDMFIGMFGHGKTLTMTHRARLLYERYGDTIQFISNYDLKGIPYTPLHNFKQIVEVGKKAISGESEYVGTVVLIDEIEALLSHRNYANFPLEMLNSLCQQRKAHIYIMCSAQRFFMVDKIFRSITTHVIDCVKLWRFQSVSYYDAWDYENAMNSQLLCPLSKIWWFVRNSDFESYDTSQMISESDSKDFISNEEAIIRKGLDATTNLEAVTSPSRKLRKIQKKN